ncbi:LacI family DNA-binding transcriptional regulator [Thiolinea disciformis]|uniref:LacI family DNA-binding transcriptional regulator n=1 Tax=Thiolinea disciformis TaxID=125614 RepID=UPI000364DE65|nr:LacI family DNA-binding transcriptional regulator [Thiolinea disciformis]
MAKRITIADVAQAAGVSIATVDRVMNKRHPVREVTAKRVYEAATSIGYHAANVIGARLQHDLPVYRVGILLQRPQQAFYQALARTLEQQAQLQTQCRLIVDIEFLESQVPSTVAQRLHKLGQRVQAVAIATIDHASITAVVEALKALGVPVFSLLSDMADGVRTGYVGVDNRKAGRLAAWLISKMTKRSSGKVALFVGSHRFLGHEMRELGFRTYFREHAPEFEVIDTVLNLEDLSLTHEATLDLLGRYPDLVGFYVAGGGMEGAIAALREEQKNGQLMVVCNELTPDSRAALVDEIITLVISTPLVPLAQVLFTQMINALEGKAYQSQSFLAFEVYTSENL